MSHPLPTTRRFFARALACIALTSVFPCACRERPSGASATSNEIPADRPARAHRERFGEVTLQLVELGRADAPLLVVVHGGPGLDHTYLRPWLDPLADRHHLVYVDLRGHGHSDLPPDANGYTISAAALDLHNVIQSLGHGAPADVLAHDFGCSVAMELAVGHAESVNRLVLVGPYTNADQIRSMPDRARRSLGDAGYAAMLALSTPQGTLRDPRGVDALFRSLGRMWFHRIPSDAVYRRLSRDVTYHAAADEHFLVSMAGWAANQRAPEVRASTLVISGDDDQTFPPEDSRALAEILPHGRYAAVVGAGHLPFVEQPVRFRDTVEGFLGGERTSQ
jgi:proline iminopeptidase